LANVTRVTDNPLSDIMLGIRGVLRAVDLLEPVKHLNKVQFMF